MVEFKESKHPRNKDGKFTTKGNGENKQNREKELLNKFIKRNGVCCKNTILKGIKASVLCASFLHCVELCV